MNKRDLTKWRENYTVWDSPCMGEGLYLHVHFDEKDDVKRLGGRWNPDPSGKGGHWWMPNHRLDKDCPIEDEENWGPGGSGTTLDWLNNHKMIAGQYGKLNVSTCLDYANEDNPFVGHRLLGTDGEGMLIAVYEEAGIVRLIEGDDGSHPSDEWLTTSDGRDRWELLMQSGYRKIIANEEVSA